jgi:hypothetical protein
LRTLIAFLTSACCLGVVAEMSGSMNLAEPQQLTIFQPPPAQSRMGRIGALRQLLALSDPALHHGGGRIVSLVASLDDEAAGQTAESAVVPATAPHDLLQKGKDEYRARNYTDAARDLRDAAQGFMSPAEMQHYIDTGHYVSLGDFETALIYLSLSYEKMGRARDAREPVLRLQAAERVEPHYADLKLDADAAGFEALANRVAPAMPLPPNSALAQLRGVTTETTVATATPPPPPLVNSTTIVTTTADNSAAMPPPPVASASAEPPPPPSSAAPATPQPFSPPPPPAAIASSPTPTPSPEPPAPVVTAASSAPAAPSPEPPPPPPAITASAASDTTWSTPTGPKLAVEPTVAEQRAAEQRRVDQEAGLKIAAQRAEVERQASERIAAERAASEKAAADRIASERAASERAADEKIAAARAESERAAAARVASERAAADKAADERIAAERAASEKAANEKIAVARADADRLASERIATERAAADRAANERVATAQAEARRNLYTTLRQAEAFATNGEIDTATNVYTRLLNSPEVSRDTLAVVATGLYRTGDFNRAVQAFQKVGTFNRGEEDLRYYYAVSLYETGHYADAKKELVCALPFIEINDAVTRYRAKIEGSADRQAAAH